MRGQPRPWVPGRTALCARGCATHGWGVVVRGPLAAALTSSWGPVWPARAQAGWRLRLRLPMPARMLPRPLS